MERSPAREPWGAPEDTLPSSAKGVKFHSKHAIAGYNAWLILALSYNLIVAWDVEVKKTMPKTTKFSELRAKMSPEARAEARRLAGEDLKEMPLHELRAARHLTQQQLARTLDMTQAAVSQLEQRTDIYLSTLENFVEAMGGRLEMYAVFPDGKVKLGLDRETS